MTDTTIVRSRSTTPPSRHASRWLWLTWPIAALAVVAAGGGILFESTYARDLEHFAVQGRSQDFVTLFVAVPALLILERLARRGVVAARLVWHGVAFYFAYTYAIAAFMVQFNAYFLVYTSILAAATFAVLGGLSEFNGTADRVEVPAAWPRRPVAIFLAVIASAFGMLWLGEIIPAILDGSQPVSLEQVGTPTNGVEVIDLALLIPGSLVVAGWVWRRDVRGYVLATAILSYLVVLGLALAAMVVGLAAAGLDAEPAVSVVGLAMTAAALTILTKVIAAWLRAS